MIPEAEIKRKFPGAKIVHKFDDGTCIIRAKTREDLLALQDEGGGCIADHEFWAIECKPISEYFFSLLNKEGKNIAILFCKRAKYFGRRHPQHDEHSGWITSDYYDRDGGYIYDPVKDAERNYESAKKRMQILRERAIREHGQLGKDHPWKKQLDDQNRFVSSCLENIEKAKLSKHLDQGVTFRYRGVKLAVVQLEGSYISYEYEVRDSTKKKFIEFCEKGGPLGRAS